MKKKDAIKFLNDKGYKIVFNMSGTVTAIKWQRAYTESSVNALIKKLFN